MSLLPHMHSPLGPLLKQYHHLVGEQRIEANPAQEDIIHRLEAVYDFLVARETHRHKQSLFSFPKFSFLKGKLLHPYSHKGFYLYGDVGRGKSMMMDLFFQHIPIAYKQRLHFHQFMGKLHEHLKLLRHQQASPQKQKSASFQSKDSLLFKAADHLAPDTSLLCFDELQVTNIADAMILSSLFGHLVDKGVFIIATSNRPPKDLYKDGLQREHFLPFITMVEETFDVVELLSEKDFRIGKRTHATTGYFYPLGEDADLFMDRTFADFTNHQPVHPLDLFVQGRSLHFDNVVADIIRVDFYSLCAQPLGAQDYQEIAANFNVILLENIPRFNRDLKNELIRFITLIDVLYEHGTKLILTADAPFEHLRSDDLSVFEFSRTISRLSEMQSQEYWQKHHQNCPTPIRN
ncbi:MAG: AFG1 family ATPase [Alphaproteobacteria bacterium]|nr:AFG1 family ATPase [Alphaproteobacteria bacterium]